MDSIDSYDFHPLWVPVERQSHLSFRVKADSDAHIFLAEYFGVTEKEAYEVNIGAYTNTR